MQNTNLRFGLEVRESWESETGRLEDLAGGFVTEDIQYSQIPSPPFGTAGCSKPLVESGTRKRKPADPGVSAADGKLKDTHQHLPTSVCDPPSAGTYTVKQTYDHRSPDCGMTWTPFARHVITYSIYQKDSKWMFRVHKDNTPGGQTDEAI